MYVLSQQLEVQATDGREPERTADATVVVVIIRDESKPAFINTPYDEATVSENAAEGTVFYSKVSAQDRDLQVVQNNKSTPSYLFFVIWKILLKIINFSI